MKVGIRLPTLMSQGMSGGWPSLPRWARRAEETGFDSLWFIDHLLAAEYVFGSATLEPVVSMANVAGATEHIQIGTAVLVAPLRSRLWLAKQLGTLSAVAGDRILLGLGAGWDEREFEASGVPRAQRGRLLDQVLADLREARQTGELRIDATSIDPAPSRWAGVVVGGGSSATVRESGAPVGTAPRVVERIAQADGWFVRSSAPLDLWTQDLSAIRARRAELGHEHEGFTIFRSCFVHVSEATVRDVAIGEQLDAMHGFGWTGDRDALVSQHPHGTVDELLAWFDSAARVGVDHVVIHPVGELQEQMTRLSHHLHGPLVSMGRS